MSYILEIHEGDPKVTTEQNVYDLCVIVPREMHNYFATSIR